MYDVKEWVKQHPPSTETSATDASVPKRLETIKVNQFVLTSQDIQAIPLKTKFSVSEFSGSIGIAFKKQSLSVMYPDTDEPPSILRNDITYNSALFITRSGQEYLAAASVNQIHLWNLADNTSSVVYRFKEERHWHLCVIDERTVGCVAEQSPSDGFRDVYILHTDTEEFKLSSTFQIKASQEMSDMSHVKTKDGTLCFLLCFPWVNLVQSVETGEDKILWQVDQQQIGGPFLPWSICTDGSMVFIINVFQYNVHVVSVEDGLIVTSINLQPFKIELSGYARLQGEHLYIGHTNKEGDTTYISKFTKPIMGSNLLRIHP